MTETAQKPFVVMRKGRKRKTGVRHECGQLVHEKPTDPKIIAFKQPHRQDVPEEVRHDARAESPFGWLNLIGLISDAQYAAGKKYAAIVHSYCVNILNAPNPNPPSIAGYMQPMPGGEPMTEKQLQQLKESYYRGFEELDKTGNKATRAVNYAAIQNRVTSHESLPDLKRGLNALVDHYGLTNQKKRLYRNA